MEVRVDKLNQWVSDYASFAGIYTAPGRSGRRPAALTVSRAVGDYREQQM